jgi:hypothetical protein
MRCCKAAEHEVERDACLDLRFQLLLQSRQSLQDRQDAVGRALVVCRKPAEVPPAEHLRAQFVGKAEPRAHSNAM